MMILHNLDFNLTGALATLGIGGLAFALAAKDTISNLFGSLTVIADRPFQIGDWIVVDGQEGMVESLGFRSTRIRTFYNSLITVPNSTLINAAVDNYGARQYRRYRTVLSVTYGTPPERMEAFCEAIRQVIRDSPYTRKDSFHIYFNDYGASSLDILVYMFFQVPDWGTELRERHRFNLDILRAAKRLGVDFAFPTQTLYMERGPGAARPSDEPFTAREQIDAELARGRRVGTEIVRTTTGPRGHRPPPVSEPPSPQGGESTDGGGDA
jgi:MscS family membrane protein